MQTKRELCKYKETISDDLYNVVVRYIRVDYNTISV